MGGVRRVLYRLPEVLAAVRRGETVYVVEGEKDCDALVAAGLCATCVAGGAGKWHTVTDAAAALAGCDVVVVADRDEPGWRHAMEVARSLQAVARVRTVASAAGKDATDHLAAGYGVGDLVEVDPSAELAGASGEPCPKDTFAIVPRSVIRYGDGHGLDDACVRLFAAVDEAPGRTLSGRNEIAAALGWYGDKVTTHASHLEAAGLLHVTDHPSGSGHMATVYGVARNPARQKRGSVGNQRTTAPSADAERRPSGDGQPLRAVRTPRRGDAPVGSQLPTAPTRDPEGLAPVAAATKQSGVVRQLPTSPTGVGNHAPTSPTTVVCQLPTAILSTMSEYSLTPLRVREGAQLEGEKDLAVDDEDSVSDDDAPDVSADEDEDALVATILTALPGSRVLSIEEVRVLEAAG
jgi:5S rRNA maturation endonuclease (ribonuclease M5)